MCSSDLPWRATARNQPMREFLESIEPAGFEAGAGEGVVRLKATELQALRWKPRQPAAAERPQIVQPAARRFRGYARIASSYRTPEAIVAEMRRRAAHPVQEAEAGLSGEIELKLARIWSELLEKPVTSPEDNFFDLGGHSLLAVMLLMRIREEFGVELPVDEVYSGSLTLAALARRIEAQQMGLTGAGEFESLLAEIEGLSDEEVSALLDQASSAGDQ